ncbi:MAG: DNA repair protein RecN [Rikenellaceae bacterium]|nr:DNA repair protein RecN [Rikenellaceae bacterium]
MLRRITIQNYALIDNLEVEFDEELNTITGETGAGKSLILGALSIALGDRPGNRAMRDESRPCIIEIEFSLRGLCLANLFEELELEYGDDTIIRRTISSNGKIRSFINDIPVPVSSLKILGSKLIDIHSQHQTLLLQDPVFRMDAVDSMAGNSDILNKYTVFYKRLREAEKKLTDLENNVRNSEREMEFLKYQYEEFKAANLKEGEYEELEENVNIMSNASEIRESFILSEKLLTDDECGVLVSLKQIENSLSHIQDYSHAAAELNERIRSVSYELKDIAGELFSQGESVYSDSGKLEILVQRLDMINSLMQKYKTRNYEELFALKSSIEEKISVTVEPEEQINRIKSEIAELRRHCLSLAGQISNSRKNSAGEIGKYICKAASKLGMPNISFIVSVDKTEELTPSGYDNIRFLFSSNKNVEPGPVEKIASGGEMSRLMLCLKSLVATNKKLPTIIFDEIDTGISGETADKTGEIIESLSGYIQILNITHLPQVAAKGNSHYSVYKEDTATATNTKIRKLSDEDRISEIAKMLSGSDVTDAAISQARTLLGK